MSRVVFVSHLEGLLCAVDPMGPLINLFLLHPWSLLVLSEKLNNASPITSWNTEVESTKPYSTPKPLP